MIEIQDDSLVISFPDIHKDAVGEISFQRTLRIPDDNRSYDLPPSLGNFPLQHVDDHSTNLSPTWKKHGGAFLPMYQSEAMWINFSGGYPIAIKIAAGKINAVTGDQWNNELHDDPQDYIEITSQPWLDGFSVSKDMIRQFVAMPLGEGYTAEEQITGEAEFGGIQIIAYPMKSEVYEKMMKETADMDMMCCSYIRESSCEYEEMGLAAGGLMKQEIYEDEYSLDDYDLDNASRCYVHIINSEQYHKVTGNHPPHKSPSAKDYTDEGLPWFDYYDETKTALNGATKLAGLDSVAAKGVKKGESPLQDNDAVSPTNVIDIGKKDNTVREGEF